MSAVTEEDKLKRQCQYIIDSFIVPHGTVAKAKRASLEHLGEQLDYANTWHTGTPLERAIGEAVALLLNQSILDDVLSGRE
jgi:hypothetical protein